MKLLITNSDALHSQKINKAFDKVNEKFPKYAQISIEL